ncbi:MAG: acyloxyacyl hydrolase, partial [Nitrospirae bacterium]|nr:acyloxyacyl hydrolase [Nitrospirota bacterium]
DITGLGSRLNGNYQIGIGTHYKLKQGLYLDTEFRLHHISNTGTKEPNDPLNSSRFLIGITSFH